MKEQAKGVMGSPAVALLKGLPYLAYHAPVGILSWPARFLMNRPLAGALLLVFGMTAVNLADLAFIHHAGHRWGQPFEQAARNEAFSREWAPKVRDRIREFEDGQPLLKRLLKPPPKDWQAYDDDLHATLSQLETFIPSFLCPWAPPLQAPKSPSLAWRVGAVLVQVHHFLNGSVWWWVLFAYTGLAAPPAWKKSDLKWRIARWRALRKENENVVFIGLDYERRPHFVTRRERNHHILVAGTTGSGKTETLKTLAFNEIGHGGGLVVIDMKGDRSLAEQFFAACVAAGRGDDFLHFTLEGHKSHSYNPMASGDAIAKRDRLMSACEWSDEVFFRNETRAGLGRVLDACQGHGTITAAVLHEIFEEPKAYKQVGAWARPEIRPKFERDLANWAEFSRNLSGLRANLHELAMAPDRLSVAHADIDFREVYLRRRVVYFELNSQMRPEAARFLARVILEDLKHLSGSIAAGTYGQALPFSVYIDEARAAIYPGFIGFVSQCRTAGIALTLATQSPLDFDGETGPVTSAVVQNTWTKILFRQLHPGSADFCSAIGGTETTVKRTNQIEDDEWFGPTRTGLASEREVEGYVVHPNRLKRLATGRAYFVQGDVHTLIRARQMPPYRARFEPTIPRKWDVEDLEWLGRNQAPLTLDAPPELREPEETKPDRSIPSVLLKKR